jgi:hypothetical protein
MNRSKDHGNFPFSTADASRNPQNHTLSANQAGRLAPCRLQPPEVRDPGRIRFGAGLRRPIAK